ncbi:hypothetical protein EBT31_14465, partial [bacterium]|nr:hypothetical protein [bacterium]
VIMEKVQRTQAAKLAVFDALFAASQHPEWMRQMDGEKIPYALMAALLLNVAGHDSWRYSPGVWHDGGRVRLNGDRVESKFYYDAMPFLWEYKR